eukprot:gene1774-biopygen1618
MPKKSVAEKYGVPRNTASTWLASREKIVAAYESGGVNPKRQKMRKADNENLDKAVYAWFQNTRANNVPVSGVILKNKGLEFATSLHLPDFRASDGWLDRWKARHNVTFRYVSGEEKSCTQEMTAPWEETYLPTILSRYELKNIFNADEFGLFYKALPTKTLHYKNERCSGGKNSKERLTGLTAANAIGEKLPMFVIGKSAKPRCFKNIQSLPCRYRSQKKSWMDGSLFTEWVKEIDRKFAAEGRKIALIVDNCPAHPTIDSLQAVELIFLPPNTTSKTQPMDQGVIRSLKAYYRTHVVKKYIASIDANKEIPRIHYLNAMSYLAEAWDRVTSDTIVNCFRKAGICTASQQQSLNDADDPFQELASEIEELRARNEELIPQELTADDYIDTDDGLLAFQTSQLTDEEIIAQVSNVDGESEEECELIEEEVVQPPTKGEVFQALDVLQTSSLFCAEMGNEMRKKINSVSKLYDIATRNKKEQKYITDFFA